MDEYPHRVIYYYYNNNYYNNYIYLYTCIVHKYIGNCNRKIELELLKLILYSLLNNIDGH